MGRHGVFSGMMRTPTTIDLNQGNFHPPQYGTASLMENLMKPCIKIFCVATLLAASALSSSAMAREWTHDGDWMIRARAIGVLPDESSSITPIGGKADFDNNVVPELDFTYFFTKNIAAELILATSHHNATAEGTTVGDVDVGSAWVLPPTLTLQYHFTELPYAKPYVGAGINYTMYYDEEPGSQTSLKMKDDFGYALQAGVDVPIDDNWGWNLDVKKSLWMPMPHGMAAVYQRIST